VIKLFETLGILRNGLSALLGGHEPLTVGVECYGFNTKCLPRVQVLNPRSPDDDVILGSAGNY
jgi:hypothetical protein